MFNYIIIISVILMGLNLFSASESEVEIINNTKGELITSFGILVEGSSSDVIALKDKANINLIIGYISYGINGWKVDESSGSHCQYTQKPGKKQVTFSVGEEGKIICSPDQKQPSENVIIEAKNNTWFPLQMTYNIMNSPSPNDEDKLNAQEKKVYQTRTWIRIDAVKQDDQQIGVQCKDVLNPENIKSVTFTIKDNKISCDFVAKTNEKLKLGSAITEVAVKTISRIDAVKKYIQEIKKLGKQPKLVIGATSTDDFGGEIDSAWVLANNDIQDEKNPRNMYLDFLQHDSLEIISQEFANTFSTITFDNDVLNYMAWNEKLLGYKKFGRDDILLIKNMLTKNGTFYMPRQFISGAGEFSINSLADFIFANKKIVESDYFVNEKYSINESLSVGSHYYDDVRKQLVEISLPEQKRRANIRDEIENYLVRNNVQRILSSVFGEKNVVLQKKASTPFRGQQLIPYLFKATKY